MAGQSTRSAPANGWREGSDRSVADYDAIIVGGGPAGSPWPAKYAFDRFPKLSFTIAKTPQFWKLVTPMMLGEYGRP